MMSLLEDCDPRVRAAASTTACVILVKWWEAIPSNTSRSLLTTVASKCAFDKTSSIVRVAAVNGIASLLEQPLCHPVLKALLPSMQSLIHDKSEKVRYALVGLLQRVSSVRAIKFFQVVTVEHLHARLAIDFQNECPSTPSAIVRLFIPSYLPSMSDSDDHEKDEVHLKRCLTFLKQSPTAALGFYSLALEHSSVADMKNMIEILFLYAHSMTVRMDEETSSQVLAVKDSNAAGVDEEEEEEEVDASAPPTPDKRSKRKHRGKKMAAAEKAKSSANVVLDKHSESRVLVALALECAANIFESLQAHFKKNKDTIKEHEVLGEKLMNDDDGIPSLYRLLANKESSHNDAARTALLKFAAYLPVQHVNFNLFILHCVFILLKSFHI
jgi:hypothetical protein